MAKSVCGHHYAQYVSDEQGRLLEGGEKDIGKYHAALVTVDMVYFLTDINRG